MVWCMKNGLIWNTSAADVLESEWMLELKKAERRRDIKIIEDEFDEHGRAMVKIVYMDAGDWDYKYRAKNDYYRHCVMDGEKRMVARLKNEDERSSSSSSSSSPLFGRARVILVRQDKDYWPGSENDPEAMERRAHKAENFFGLEVGPTGCGFDYKRIMVATDNDYHQEIPIEIDHRGLPVDREERYVRYFDPSLPGAKFIRENMHPSDLKRFPRLQAVARKYGWSWPPGCDGLNPPKIS